jgi:hypothetical protein
MSEHQGAPVTRRSSERDEPTLTAVIADLWEHSETLVRQELALVRAEYEARALHAKAAVQHGALSLGLFHAAYLCTLATLVLVLAQWLDPWLSASIIAVAAGLAAAVFALLGKRAFDQATEPFRHDPPPHHPIRRARAIHREPT